MTAEERNSEARENGQKALATHRARDRAAIQPVDIPQGPLRAARAVGWISERMAEGSWAPDDVDMIASEWGLSPATVKSYATQASRWLEYSTDDVDRLRALVKTKLQAIASDEWLDDNVPGGINARIKSLELLLRTTGDLSTKGTNAARDEMFTDEEHFAHAVQQVRYPSAEMRRLLVEAFREPGPKLLEILQGWVESSCIETKGEER